MGAKSEMCTCVGTIVPFASLSWVYFGSVSGRDFRASLDHVHETFKVDASRGHFNAIAPGVGIELLADNQLSMAASYNAEFGRKRQEQEVSLDVRYQF